MKKVSYRFDALSLTLNPRVDLEIEMKYAGYPLRLPEPDDDLRSAKGYNKANARVMDIHNPEFKDPLSFTIQTRYEGERPDSGFFATTGDQLDCFDYRDFLSSLKQIIKGTRADIACDIEYQTDKEKDEEFLKLCKLVGFDPASSKAYTQNPVNNIAPGKRKGAQRIKKASMIVSNGLTLYIGGRQSKFMVRVYDKSAEVLQKTGKEINPTLRFEIEAKQEIADAVIEKIIEGEDSKELWHSISDDYLMFDLMGKKISLAKVMGIDEAREIEIDYKKREGEKMKNAQWIKKYVSPAFHKAHKKLSDEEKIEKLIEYFGLKK